MKKIILLNILISISILSKAQQEAYSLYTNSPINIDGNIENNGEWGNWDALLSKLPYSSEYAFDSVITKEVLLKYLSRSATFNGLAFSETLYDDYRLIKNIRPKFLGRISYVWNRWTNFPGRPSSTILTAEELFNSTKSVNEDIHLIDPDIITQACIFEIVDKGFVENIHIPEYIFNDFGLPVEDRNFDYSAMLYDGTHYHDYWSENMSVPDITKQETQFWFYYLATQYINSGIESLHMGQIELMNDNDDQYNSSTFYLFNKIREYAHHYARRHLVLIDAHVPNGGFVDANNNLLFDFHSFPQRIKNDCNKQYQDTTCPTGEQYWAYLTSNFVDAIYGRSIGGITPSGWTCTSLPYIVEFDNYGNQPDTGECNNSYWPWGWDEVSWFANCTPEYRTYYLNYAYNKVHELDPGIANLEMPLKIPMNVEEYPGYRAWYRANNQSNACPLGYNVENTIKNIWGELNIQQNLLDTINAIADNYQYQNQNGTSDNIVLWKSRWDNNYLYLAVIVSDSVLIGAANHINPDGAEKFKCDRIDIAIGNKPENYNQDMNIGDEQELWWDPGDSLPDGWGIENDDIFGGIFLLNSRINLVNANNDFKANNLDYVIKYHPNILTENGKIISGYIFEARIPWETLTSNDENIYMPEVDNKLIFEIINGDAESITENLTQRKSWGNSVEAFISLNNAGFLVLKDENLHLPLYNKCNIKISPNPVHNYMTIKTNEELIDVKIFDIQGHIVISEKTNNKKINVSQLKKGMYFVKITTLTKKYNLKVIKI